MIARAGRIASECFQAHAQTRDGSLLGEEQQIDCTAARPFSINECGMMKRGPFRHWLAVVLPIAFLRLRRLGPSATKTLRVGFVPSEDAQQVMQNAQPIVEILRKQLGMEIQPFVATDYTGVVEALRVNKLDIAFLTPASYVLAKNEANVRVVLKSERKGMPYYYAAIIVRADSGIKNLEDLRGKSFAFGDSLSTTGNVIPRQMFKAARHRSGARLQTILLFRRA